MIATPQSLRDSAGLARDHLGRFVASGAGLLALLTLLWLGTEHALDQEEANARNAASLRAHSLANSYATQLQHLAEQMDQITLRIAYQWQDAPQAVDLARDWARGLFPREKPFFVYIANARGDPVRLSFDPVHQTNIADKPFFRMLRDDCCDGLLISPPEFSELVDRQVVRFSRRLETTSGAFAGVVVILVEPNFLATFQDEAGQGPNDFLTVRLDTGQILATRLGSEREDNVIFNRQPPRFATERGVTLEPAATFRDARQRYVAWRKLERYPLVALAGLTEADALAAYRVLARSYRLTAMTASLFLVMFWAAGMVFATKLAARRRAEEDIRSTYRMATDAADEGFYMLRALHDDKGALCDFQVEDCNERAAALLGKKRSELAGKRASQVMHQALHRDLVEVVRRALAHGVYEDQLRVPSPSWLSATWVHRRAVHSGPGIALTLRDISEIKAHEEALADLANNDPLTRLPNRRWLMNYLPSALQRAKRGRGRLALLFIDLDNFKIVNDTLGHEAGDELLMQAALRIRQTVRASDHVARLGGDEFTVVLEQIDSDADAAHVAAGIINTMAEPFELAAGGGNRVSASVGISIFPEHGDDAESLLKHADVAMYAAKAAGRARYHLYHPSLSEALIEKLSRERTLRLAIERDEFIVHYQPRVGAHSGKLCSLEALLRWQHPERGIVSPAEFIDVAEDAGLIVRIGEMVIDKVAGQLVAWRDAGMSLVPVSVNISPYQLQSGTTSATLAAALQRYGLEARLLEIEVTESAVVDRSMVVSRELDALRALGLRLMIDDFGAGYSSLAQLHRLDVDALKVDRAFTRALSTGSEGEVLYRAIVSMATALEMTVVAEGVETREQLRLLQLLGCHEVQGYLISRALPPEDMARLAMLSVLPPFDAPTIDVIGQPA